MNIDNPLNPAVYAADLAKTIAAEQTKMGFMPDWWQQVVAEMHSQLDKQFPPFHDDAPVEQPDYFQLPGMEHKRMDLMDWRFNGIEARLGTLESNASAFRLTALEERLSALEDWADIRYVPGDDAPVDGIHALIAEGMTSVTADMQEHVAQELAHTGDALLLEIQALRALLDETQDLCKAVLKIDALENRAPC